MSGTPSGVTPQRGAKVMSSRLANMKFMQRAAAAPSTPGSGHESSARPLNVTPSQKVPSQSIRAPGSARGELLQPLGVNGAETMWTLDWTGAGRTTGNSVSPDDDPSDPAPWADADGLGKGRMQYGGYSKIAEKHAFNNRDEGEVSESGQNSDSNSSPDEEAQQFAEKNLARVREARVQKSKKERERSRKVVGQRKQKEVRMNVSKSNQRRHPAVSSSGT